MINYDEFYQAKFIGKREYCGLKKNKLYSIKVNENQPYGISVDVLDEDDNKLYCTYANINSIDREWDVRMGN